MLNNTSSFDRNLPDGKRIDYPPSQQVNATFKKAKKAATGSAEVQLELE
jgi:hypothetical protein